MPVIGYGVSRTKDRRRQRYGAHTHEQPVQMCWARRVQAVRAARGWPCRRRRTHLCGGHVCRRWSSRVVVGFVCSLRLRSASSVYSVDRSSQAFAGSHGSVAQLQVRFGADPDLFGSQIQGDLLGASQWRIYQGVAKEFGSATSDSSP